MKWHSKTSLNNPLRPFTVSGQQLLTNNVPKQSVTQECYTPVNNNVVII